MMSMLGNNVVLGLIAGITIFVGLLVGRVKNTPAWFRPILALLSAGIIVFLTIEIGYNAFESVETSFRLGKPAIGIANLGLVTVGLLLGLVALGAWEDRRSARNNGQLAGFDVALLAAVGIGAHNFGEGLAIGQSYASGATALGASLVIGFALHNATEGFGIIGGLRGEKLSWSRIALLGAIGGGPTVVGSAIGGVWTNAALVTFSYSIAAGSLLFVIRELLRIPFKISARLSLTAVMIGILIGLATDSVVVAAQAAPQQPTKSGSIVQLRIQNGRFSPMQLEVPSNAQLLVKNEDDKVFTLEGAGILRGDVPIDARTSQNVSILGEPGTYSIFIEEDPAAILPITVSAAGSSAVAPASSLMPTFWKLGRQPVEFVDGSEPTYASYTSFNIVGSGEKLRKSIIDDLFAIEVELGQSEPPPALAQYFTKTSWRALSPSVAMIYGLGPTSFDSARFGNAVAQTKPKELRTIAYGQALKFDAKATQRDIIVRVTSSSSWFNQQVCRYVWKRLNGRITGATLESGYSNPNGRSPILGGFFDGTGNPIGKDRELAVYGDAKATSTYLTWFKIRFDQDRFLANTLAKNQVIIGREQVTGRQLPTDKPNSHRFKTEGDSTRTILRLPFVYDSGPSDVGLLFASAQSSIANQFEGIIRGFMMNPDKPGKGTGVDRLMEYMEFVQGGYYFIPGIPNQPAETGSSGIVAVPNTSK